MTRKKGVSYVARKALPFAYDRLLAPLLPRTRAVYNGVEVEAARWFDSTVPWRQRDRQHYESGIVSGMERHVDAGDDIVIVGGGWGVTAVRAAESVGESGSVTVYEGSEESLRHVEDTVRRNGVADEVDLRHAVVGPKVSLRGAEGDGATRLSPEQLPECDVLELDCEGSEIEILENLTVRPETIVVETHGMNGAPSAAVESRLEELSYSVVSKQVADLGCEDSCIENDVYVLVGSRETE